MFCLSRSSRVDPLVEPIEGTSWCSTFRTGLVGDSSTKISVFSRTDLVIAGFDVNPEDCATLIAAEDESVPEELAMEDEDDALMAVELEVMNHAEETDDS